MKIVFFGTPQFAAEILSYLLKNGIEVAAVVTKPDKPKGRSGTPIPTPVKLVALSQNPPLPIYQPELVSAPEFSDTLIQYQADLFVVVAFGEIIKQHLLDMPKLGCINVHASLLPKYRGAAPIQRSIINNETETGITIMHMVRKMDAGDIIHSVAVPIGIDTNYGELEKKLCQVGAEALLNVIHEFAEGNIRRVPQKHEQATYAPKLELEDCQIDWQQSAQSIHNLVRGTNPYPGAWCWVNIKGQQKRLKVLKTKVVDNRHGSPGQVLLADIKGVIVACGQQALQIVDLQLEGKKAMPAEELMRGLPKESLETFISLGLPKNPG